MIEQVTAYRLTCQGCGAVLLKEWVDIRDTRVLVRSFGWWCADQAQTVDRKIVWHVRCAACGEPTQPGAQEARP